MRENHLNRTIPIVLIACILAGIFLLRGETPTPTPTPTPTTAGTIQVPDGPKIKVVFNGPPELKVEWEKVGMAGDGFQVQLIGTLKNVSSQAVKFSEISFLFDGHQVDYIPGRTLGLGEIMKILKGFPGYTENTKVLEIKVKGFEVVGGSTITPKPTVTEPATTPSSEIRTFNLSFTEEVLKNPISPGEILATYCFLASQERYSEAAKLLTKELLQRIEQQGGLEQVARKTYQGRQLKRVEFWRETIEADQINAYVDDPTLYYANGDKESDKGSISLVKEASGWKIQQ